MTRKRIVLITNAFFIAICLFFIIISLSSWTFWPKIIIVPLFVLGIVMPIYWKYRFKHSGKKEKKRMIAQK